jgi:hypothetical protein
VANYFSGLDITALSLNGAQLREAVAETLALKEDKATIFAELTYAYLSNYKSQEISKVE